MIAFALLFGGALVVYSLYEDYFFAVDLRNALNQFAKRKYHSGFLIDAHAKYQRCLIDKYPNTKYVILFDPVSRKFFIRKVALIKPKERI